MSIRGRGTLEIRPSDNPFFQPTSRDIGLTAADQVDWKVSGRPPQFPTAKHSVDGNFAFLYTRESDMIGAKVPKPYTMSETKLLTRTEFLKQRREKALSETNGLEPTEDNIHHEPPRPKVTVEEILKVYKHEPKYEDPRYITSNTDYGKKAPSVATFVAERTSKPQDFSKSFQNIKPKQTGLNTSLTKSNVHRSLDPQFA